MIHILPELAKSNESLEVLPSVVFIFFFSDISISLSFLAGLQSSYQVA